ncbi:antigen identified by monoclonal antibody Ki-67 [Mortierella sp. AD031]|nr:antigen identified by monoclonal antibody Ki-67 [Mortierella sp. AD031]
MSDTPKSPARRVLRKSALQASPFGAPVKSFLKTAPPSSSTSSPYTTPTINRTKNLLSTITSTTTTAAETDIQDEGSTSPLDSPTSRKSARLSNIYKHMDLNVTPKKAPTTPKSKTRLKLGVWAHIVGLKKQDQSEYCRLPVDKSYCSFGRGSSNDVPIPFEDVSEMHCKLIRREDGEVWLKDTSTIGTYLNNVLVHDTARPIEENDILTIAGRSFRFELSMPIPRLPLQVTDENTTPGRHIKSLQSAIDSDISALTEAPSPTAGKISTTPKRNPSRNAEALEVSLGLFTPKSAAKLSSLLVSPKPVPIPAFLAKSPGNLLTATDKPLAVNNESDTPQDGQEWSDNPAWHTPTKEKRKPPEDFNMDLGRTPKKVSFGPSLNPEIFSKHNPPNTPIKRGDQQPPAASTPSFLSKLAAAGSTPKSILTPSRSSRTNIIQGLEKPTPLKLKLFSPKMQKAVITPKKQDSVAQDLPTSASRKSPLESDDSDSSASGSDDDLWKKSSSRTTSDAFTAPIATESENFSGDDGDDDDDDSPPSTPTRILAGRQSSSTPNRPKLSLTSQDVQQEHLHHSFKLHTSPIQPDADNPFISNDEAHGDSPSHSPTLAALQRHHPGMTATLEEVLSTPLTDEVRLPPQADAETSAPDADIPDITPAHTPVRSRTKDYQRSDATPHGNTPGSASRLALLQLSAQKIRGLPDLLQSPSSSSLARETSDTAPTTPKRTIDVVASEEDSKASGEATAAVLELDSVALDDQAEEDEEQQEEEENLEAVVDSDHAENGDQSDLAGSEVEAETLDDTAAVFPRDDQRSHAWSTTGTESKRRSSAPAASTILHPQSPIFNGLRGVFRTPQKVVETCFAGFTGIRNFVMTPTRSPRPPSAELPISLPEAAEAEDSDADENPFQVKSDDSKEEEAVETFDVQESALPDSGTERHGLEVEESSVAEGSVERESSSVEDPTDQDGGEATDPNITGQDIIANETIAKDNGSDAPTSITTSSKRRISSHRDALALLTGSSGELSPKSKEFTFATEPLEQIKARGRRSDIFPQKRTVAKRSHSQSGDDVNTETDGHSGSTRRRRTISMFEFMAAVSSTVSRTSAPVHSEATAAESQEQQADADETGEDAELLRLLGEGADSGQDDDESGEEVVNTEEAIKDVFSYEEPADGDIVEDASNGAKEELLDVKEVVIMASPRRGSGSFREKTPTPTKKRNSFKGQLGSSSPGFGLYEQDGDEDEEDNDDDVVMISPKRIRVQQ